MSKEKRAEINKENLDTNTVILNVGGIKYETLRSTLMAYPNTLLGTMFSSRNKPLLKPINGNEYFFDRNGRAFHYIMEYYRTGKLHFPSQADNNNKSKVWVTKEEIETELDYFLIEVQYMHKIHQMMSEHLNHFIKLMEERVTEQMIKWRRNLKIRVTEFSIIVNPGLDEEEYLFRPGKEVAFQIAAEFFIEIKQHFENSFTGLKVNYVRDQDFTEFEFELRYDRREVLRMSHLKVIL
ncbi:2308_t:CDS:2 [Ambispora gerdemannii]|uniref:2308_t:CDS:1 n=1 Tax=Ambispora gerdemannii TaxID=144530 RepID=A0A9N8ZG85_9GLOM|nr:2308_t:CDS:2 [Ambispora gerdemannii]